MRLTGMVIISTFLIVFYSCRDIGNRKKAQEVRSMGEHSIPKEDTLIESSTNIKTQKEALNEYFNSPMDLDLFKGHHKYSNSGGTKLNFFYQPKVTGFYYSYFAFESMEVGQEDGIWITVFKKDSTIGNYLDSNDVVVEIKARVKNEGLGNSNFVTQDTAIIYSRFGKPITIDKTTGYYQCENKFLIMNFTKGKINWFKYIFSNTTEFNDLPAEVWTNYR